MISDKTVDLLTRIREFCEEIVDVGLGERNKDALVGTAAILEVMTDIMDYLMDANVMEQEALAAISSDFRGVEALRASAERLNNAMKESTN